MYYEANTSWESNQKFWSLSQGSCTTLPPSDIPLYCLLMICVTGWLYDMSNSYNNSFYMMGICLILSGVVVSPIPCIQRRRLRHDNKEPQLIAETSQA